MNELIVAAKNPLFNGFLMKKKKARFSPGPSLN